MIRPESLNRCMKKWVLSIAVQLAEKIETEEEEQDKKKEEKVDGCGRRKRDTFDWKNEKVRQSVAYRQCPNR